MQHHFIKGRDIVLFSFQAWDSEIGFNLKDMAYELAKHNRVLFINRAEDRASLIAKKKIRLDQQKKNQENLIQIGENFWVYDSGLVLESINWISWNPLYDFLNKMNNKRLARKINEVIRKLSLKDVILINDNDFFRGFYLKRLISSCRTYIFYIRDFLTIQPYFKKHGVRLEKELIRKSDIVVANSAYLASYARQWNSNSFDIGQGCDFEGYSFSEKPGIPEDLLQIPRPVIGYCGAITAMRLDEEIVENISRSFPQCSIVLVGPEDEYFASSKLKKLKNIYFLGAKPPKTIPGYIYYFDICINPQLTNPLTIGNYPRKVDEYLALGKPVVATATEGMMMFKEHVFLCEGKEDYIKMINLILSNQGTNCDDAKQRRINFAFSHTWENSIGLLGDAYHAVVEYRQQ